MSSLNAMPSFEKHVFEQTLAKAVQISVIAEKHLLFFCFVFCLAGLGSSEVAQSATSPDHRPFFFEGIIFCCFFAGDGSFWSASTPTHTSNKKNTVFPGRNCDLSYLSVFSPSLFLSLSLSFSLSSSFSLSLSLYVFLAFFFLSLLFLSFFICFRSFFLSSHHSFCFIPLVFALLLQRATGQTITKRFVSNPHSVFCSCLTFPKQPLSHFVLFS